MAPNHLTKLAASSCSSINVRTTYPPRPAYPEDGIKHESLDYETNNDLIISNYASNCMIGDANSDQSPSGNASNCDQKQVGTNQAGDYSTGISAATDRYIGAQACVGDAGAISCKRDHAERHAISRREMCLAADPGGDQHSSSGAGMCAAASAEAPEIAIAKYNGSSAAVKAEVGYTDTAASGKCRSGGSTAAGANNAGESTSDAGAAAGKMSRRKKFVGVRQRPSGRWVAEIKDTTQKIRMWLGTFDTAEDAARAYDEAACLLRGSNTRTNFMPLQAPPSPSPSPLASRLAHMLRARQNRDVRLQSSSPSSPPRATAAIERGPRHPLRFSLSPTSPLSSSVYSHNRTPVQSTDSISAKRYPDCIDTSQNANPHTNHVLHNSFRSPCIRKTYGNQQDAYMSNQGSGLHLLHPHTAAHNSTLWGSSKGESGSSDSDFSPPHADYFRLHKRHRMHLQDCSHSLSMYKAGFTTADGCNKSAHGMPGTYLGKEILGELPCTHPGPANEDMDWDERKQIFASDKNIISAEDIHTLTRDQQSMRGNDSYHHNYGEGGFMEALMAGIKDDMTMDSSSAYDYNTTQTVCPFDFSVEAPMAASSMIKMDEFPLINELSGKLEEAEGGLHYVNAHEEKEGSNHGSSSNGMLEGTHHSLESGTNSDLEMKRMRFERIDSASLYALNGVHEMAIKQLTPSLHPGTNYVAGNSTSTSFNFLSNSPSYLLSSPWKPWSALSVSISTACSDAVPVNASSITGAFINRPSSNPSHNCPSDSIASNNNSTHTSPNIGSETINIGPASSGTSNISTDAQSQEAAMWNSWDLAPLCPLVA